MTLSLPTLDALLPLVDDLSRELPEAERYRRLLGALRSLVPCDASALLRLEGRETITHFRTAARATGLPIMIYNNHVAYKVDLKPEDFADLASEKNIVAVKESSHDSRRITDMINLLGDRYAIVSGVDDLFLENALFGATGWVSGLANSFPREAVQLHKLAKAGKIGEALDLYRWFMPLLHLDVATKLVQYIKLANQMTGEGSEWVRAPRLTLEGEERKRISAIIQQAIDTRPQLKMVA